MPKIDFQVVRGRPLDRDFIPAGADHVGVLVIRLLTLCAYVKSRKFTTLFTHIVSRDLHGFLVSNARESGAINCS